MIMPVLHDSLFSFFVHKYNIYKIITFTQKKIGKRLMSMPSCCPTNLMKKVNLTNKQTGKVVLQITVLVCSYGKNVLVCSCIAVEIELS